MILFILIIFALLLFICFYYKGLENKDKNIASNNAEESIEEKIKREKTLKILRYIISYSFLTLMAIIVIIPFYWMIITSLKSTSEYNAEVVPSIFPNKVIITNYITAFKEISLGKYLLNTVIFAVTTTLLMVITSTLAAFAFARLEFKGKNLLFTIFLALMIVPNELVIITNYTTIVKLNLRNNFIGLIGPSILSIFYLYLLRQNFMQVPDEIYYAAKVDGTSDFKYLLKILLPISKPTIITITILKLIECWNSFVWPRLITNKEAYYLVSQGIQMLRENGFGRENIPVMMAAVVIVSLPLLALFITFRKQIMSGVTKGGLKG